MTKAETGQQQVTKSSTEKKQVRLSVTESESGEARQHGRHKKASGMQPAVLEWLC